MRRSFGVAALFLGGLVLYAAVLPACSGLGMLMEVGLDPEMACTSAGTLSGACCEVCSRREAAGVVSTPAPRDTRLLPAVPALGQGTSRVLSTEEVVDLAPTLSAVLNDQGCFQALSCLLL